MDANPDTTAVKIPQVTFRFVFEVVTYFLREKRSRSREDPRPLPPNPNHFDQFCLHICRYKGKLVTGVASVILVA